VRVGQAAKARLVDGRDVEGVVSFVAQAAQTETRTYRVEVTVANADHSIRSGITADLRIPAGIVEAHRISPALLALDDKGGVGVRIVDADKTVEMVPVRVIKDDAAGIWVVGLPASATVITVGQELVVAGDKVDVSFESNAPGAAETDQAPSTATRSEAATPSAAKPVVAAAGDTE